MNDDEATIIMVDSNLQREKTLPSEKAFAYKMKLEAKKHQGKQCELTSARGVQKLTTREKIAQDAGEKPGILDRVLHHCTVINIKGEFYRLKERKEFVHQKQQIVNSLFEQGKA